MFQKATLVAGTVIGLAATAQAVAEWGQCGGINYTGSKTCDSGLTCVVINDWYYQCLRVTTSTRPPSSTARPTSTSSVRPPSSSSVRPPSSSSRPVTTTTVRPPSSSSRPSSTTSSRPPITSGSACAPITTNPYESGWSVYLSPYYAAEIDAAVPLISDSTLRAKAATVKNIPTFTWFDVKSKVPTLSTYLANAAAQGPNTILQIVIYDLPNRDCHAKASNGELRIENNGVNIYKTEYIDPIAAAIDQYPSVRVVAVVEPDSLANMVTNMSDPNCQTAEPAYRECTKYVLEKLKQCNVWLYMDAGHGGWLGWPANIDPAATLFSDIYKSVSGNRLRGLASNVSNYNALANASPHAIYQSNPNYDEVKYINALAPKVQSLGFPAKFLVDTGRSGVQDIRDEWGNWCNIEGAGFGIRPGPYSNQYIDQLVWIKPGGECDGTSDTSAVRYDSTCGLPDAKKPAPEAGQWFQAYFVDLVRNANPPL